MGFPKLYLDFMELCQKKLKECCQDLPTNMPERTTSCRVTRLNETLCLLVADEVAFNYDFLFYSVNSSNGEPFYMFHSVTRANVLRIWQSFSYPYLGLNTHVNVRPGNGKVPIRWYPIVDVFEKFVLAASQPSYLRSRRRVKDEKK